MIVEITPNLVMGWMQDCGYVEWHSSRGAFFVVLTRGGCIRCFDYYRIGNVNQEVDALTGTYNTGTDNKSTDNKKWGAYGEYTLLWGDKYNIVKTITPAPSHRGLEWQRRRCPCQASFFTERTKERRRRSLCRRIIPLSRALGRAGCHGSRDRERIRGHLNCRPLKSVLVRNTYRITVGRALSSSFLECCECKELV
jgi:hypothetical protein